MEQERRIVLILMSAGGETDLVKALTALLNSKLGAYYDFQSREIPKASKFLEYAQAESIDVFLIVLNNIIPDADAMFPETGRLDQALKILSYLKERYHKPVFALSGYFPAKINLAAEALRAGADYFSALPPNADDFVQAMRSCLEHADREPTKG